jgi:hypothetical protein
VYLYKQHIRTDRFEALQKSIQYHSGRGTFLTVALTPLDNVANEIKDVPSLSALTMLQLLGNSVPSQTASMERPSTPQPPAPEPVPIYTQAEIDMQNAALDAEAKAKQKPVDERHEEEEEEA